MQRNKNIFILLGMFCLISITTITVYKLSSGKFFKNADDDIYEPDQEEIAHFHQMYMSNLKKYLNGEINEELFDAEISNYYHDLEEPDGSKKEKIKKIRSLQVYANNERNKYINMLLEPIVMNVIANNKELTSTNLHFMKRIGIDNPEDIETYIEQKRQLVANEDPQGCNFVKSLAKVYITFPAGKISLNGSTITIERIIKDTCLTKAVVNFLGFSILGSIQNQEPYTFGDYVIPVRESKGNLLSNEFINDLIDEYEIKHPDESPLRNYIITEGLDTTTYKSPGHYSGYVLSRTDYESSVKKIAENVQKAIEKRLELINTLGTWKGGYVSPSETYIEHTKALKAIIDHGMANLYNLGINSKLKKQLEENIECVNQKEKEGLEKQKDAFYTFLQTTGLVIAIALPVSMFIIWSAVGTAAVLTAFKIGIATTFSAATLAEVGGAALATSIVLYLIDSMLVPTIHLIVNTWYEEGFAGFWGKEFWKELTFGIVGKALSPEELYKNLPKMIDNFLQTSVILLGANMFFATIIPFVPAIKKLKLIHLSKVSASMNLSLNLSLYNGFTQIAVNLPSSINRCFNKVSDYHKYNQDAHDATPIALAIKYSSRATSAAKEALTTCTDCAIDATMFTLIVNFIKYAKRHKMSNRNIKKEIESAPETYSTSQEDDEDNAFIIKTVINSNKQLTLKEIRNIIHDQKKLDTLLKLYEQALLKVNENNRKQTLQSKIRDKLNENRYVEQLYY